MAKKISLNMTKQDVIDLLDELELDLDYKTLQGATLINAKKTHHTCLPRYSLHGRQVGPLKKQAAARQGAGKGGR